MKIDLPIEHRLWGLPRWEVVPAEIVDVAPHFTELTFAVHKYKRPIPQWRVTNIETGRYAGIGKTRASAIADARKYCADKTDEQARKALRRWKRETKEP